MLGYACGTQTAIVHSMFNFPDKEKGKDKGL
jgi:hypothetical protein